MDTKEKTDSSAKDSLRLYIREIESWPLHRPPGPAELKRISRDFPLSLDQKHKLQGLIENHIYRYQKAFDKGSFNQALVEISRACVLDPANTRNRVNLARVYLKNSPENSPSSDNHRKRALRLVQDILETRPRDPHALKFLEEHEKNSQDTKRNLHPWYRLSLAIFLLLLVGTGWRERDWLMEKLPSARLLFRQEASFVNNSLSAPSTVSFDTVNMGRMGLDMDITLSRIDYRNEDPFIEIQGRVKVEGKNLGPLVFMVRGRSSDKKALFSIPWEVRRKSDPVLRPGDSQPLEFFRWLTNAVEEIESIDISPHSMVFPDVQEIQPPQEIAVAWGPPRPDGVHILAEIRNPEILEGYDRNILQAELALSNRGRYGLSALSLEFSLPLLSAGTKFDALVSSSPSMASGERRVWGIRLPLPRGKQPDPLLSTLNITSISLN